MDKEIDLTIYDGSTNHYGGSQDWYPRKMHQLSGCGPIAAANITAHLALTLPEAYKALYPYSASIQKEHYIEHMIEIRKFVKPGPFGLTSVEQFSENVLSYATKKGVNLTPHFVVEKSDSNEALDFIKSALEQSLPVAILILTHPLRQFSEFVWHWMTITQVRQGNIVVSSYGKRYELDFELLWNKRRSRDVLRLIYFS